MWLFVVDKGAGLRPEECHAISEFRRRGRGLLVTQDHMDLDSSVCNLDGVGAIVLAPWLSWLPQALFIGAALVWLIPDRRIEHQLRERESTG